jgi:hypothetical protein
MVAKLYKHIKTLHWKFLYNNLKSSTFKEGKLFIWEFLMRENLTLVSWEFR